MSVFNWSNCNTAYYPTNLSSSIKSYFQVAAYDFGYGCTTRLLQGRRGYEFTVSHAPYF